ncbi:MAG: hypothetical protein LBM18_00740 [Oscillospiraceae bacterium]|nr:hypothetical protein [Oscillospiraceae bacterium]
MDLWLDAQGEAGGVFILNHDFNIAIRANRERLTPLELPRRQFIYAPINPKLESSTRITQPKWYEKLGNSFSDWATQFRDDVLALFEALEARSHALQERFNRYQDSNNILDNLWGLVLQADWMFLGFVSGFLESEAALIEELSNNYSVYNLLNAATFGWWKSLNGAFTADEVLSLEHVLDIIAVIPVLGMVLDKIVKAAIGTTISRLPLTAGTNFADDGARAALPDAEDVAGTLDDNLDEIIRESLDDIPVINGQVGGKVPINDYLEIRAKSVINPASDTLTLGKYADDFSSYTVRAGETMYFDLGDEWDVIRQRYNLSADEMFDYFNVPVLDEAIGSGKAIRFSHNPVEYMDSALGDEWEYIKGALSKTDEDLTYEGGFWYVK